MGSIPKFLASMVTILLGVVVCISFIISSIVVNSARTYHSSVIDHIEASSFDEVTIRKCILAADKDNYKLTIDKEFSSESEGYFFYKVTMQYTLYAPIFGKVHTGTLVGYALPGAHVDLGVPESSEPAPGLYETGSQYTVLVKDWDTLVSEGLIQVTNGAAGTGYVSGSNPSSSYLSGDLLFPYDGSVTQVADLGFFKCELLTGIRLPNDLECIGEEAFAGCAVLNTVDLGTGIERIEYSAFDYCGAIRTVTYGGSVDEWCKIVFETWQSNPVYYGADLYIDDTLVVNLTIPAEITSIKNAFTGCGSLESVIIADGSQLLTVDDYAFARCYNLKSVALGKGVAEIGQYAFLECDLQVITVPITVAHIDSFAFNYCRYLTDIIYRGTEEQWRAITLSANWNSECGEYIVHCTDGAISKP